MCRYVSAEIVFMVFKQMRELNGSREKHSHHQEVGNKAKYVVLFPNHAIFLIEIPIASRGAFFFQSSKKNHIVQITIQKIPIKLDTLEK